MNCFTPVHCSLKLVKNFYKDAHMCLLDIYWWFLLLFPIFQITRNIYFMILPSIKMFSVSIKLLYNALKTTISKISYQRFWYVFTMFVRYRLIVHQLYSLSRSWAAAACSPLSAISARAGPSWDALHHRDQLFLLLSPIEESVIGKSDIFILFI